MAIDFTGSGPITGGGQVFVRNSNGEWERANVTAPGVVVQTFTANGTYTPSPGMIACKVILTGAGGGGGGADTDGTGAAGGGGGEAGGTCIKLYTAAEIGASAAVVIGGGGTGGADTGGDATDGGDSTFTPTGSGVTLTAGGGDGGNGENATGYPNQAPGGFNEGTATNGDINLYGGHGQYGFGTTDGAQGGAGGASFWGGGGRAGSDFGGGGTTGQVPSGLWGCGGGGAAVFNSTTGVAGGDGVGGFCYIEEYIRQSVLSPVVYDANGNELLDLSQTTASAVNHLQIVNAATGNDPALSAVGGDTNVGLRLTVQGNPAYGLDAPSAGVELGAANYTSFAISSTAATAGGPYCIVFHDSSSPAANDVQGFLFGGRDSAANTVEYGAIEGVIVDPTNGSEDYRINVLAMAGGSTSTRISIDGDGLKFNGDTAAANALDDYEEGTFTPVYTTDGVDFTSITYDPATDGAYTKIGNTVICRLIVKTDSVTVGSASGDLYVGGLPFTIETVDAQYGSAGGVSYASDFSTQAPHSYEITQADTTMLLLYQSSLTSGNNTAVPYTSIATGVNSNTFQCTVIYQVA